MRDVTVLILGSFVRFLIDRYGLDRFLTFYRSGVMQDTQHYGLRTKPTKTVNNTRRAGAMLTHSSHVALGDL